MILRPLPEISEVTLRLLIGAGLTPQAMASVLRETLDPAVRSTVIAERLVRGDAVEHRHVVRGRRQRRVHLACEPLDRRRVHLRDLEQNGRGLWGLCMRQGRPSPRGLYRSTALPLGERFIEED